MKSKLEITDFESVFKFASDYYLKKNVTSGRTSGEPRGLGAILDAFSIGKLAEYAVKRILEKNDKKKKYLINLEIQAISQVSLQPDIYMIEDNTNKRYPQCFVEIKYTSEKDDWITMTQDQFKTIVDSAKNTYNIKKMDKIFFIYVSINSSLKKSNPKSADLTGMYLKHVEVNNNTLFSQNRSSVFEDFADLNAEGTIDFILTANDFNKFAYPFERGKLLYNSNPFILKGRNVLFKKDGNNVKDVKKIKTKSSNKIKLKIKSGENESDTNITEFSITGKYDLYEKKGKLHIHCITKVTLRNNVFGLFTLKPDKIYTMFIEKKGIDPILKRDNFFISKNRVNVLIEEGKLEKPETYIRSIIRFI
jgi:hypothetical protein